MDTTFVKTESVCAGIVSYNPCIERLEKNIEAVSALVDTVLIVDNGSQNANEIESLADRNNCKYISFQKNEGIAFALNSIMKYALEHGYSWCITLDQDSVVPDNLLTEASELLNEKQLCLITTRILEKNSGETPDLGVTPDGNRFQEVPKCITSSTLTNTLIWKEVGGFDDRLFIDYVDYDYAVKCRKAGYKIIRLNNVFLNHEIGKSAMKRFLFFKVRVANHSSFRKYYISRNIVIFIRRYRHYKGLIKPFSEVLRLVKLIVLIVLYEKGKSEKLKSSFRGIKDGLRWKYV